MPELPEQLLNSLEELPHFSRKSFVAAHSETERISSVRLNPFKPVQTDLAFSGKVAWSPESYYLSERPSFTLDPLFHAGAYYVQEAGSMFLARALSVVQEAEQGKGFKILDLCASPGGKTTHLNAIFGEQGVIVANEFTRQRVSALSYNLSKWGTCNTIVCNNEPAAFGIFEGYFDLMVIDAPCSGSGLFRKQPEAIAEWSEHNVQMCSRRQRQILDDAMPALKNGGWLIYSTCSYSVEENEEIVNWLCNDRGFEYVRIPADPVWGIVETNLGFRFYPDKTPSEGFFCALLRKKDGQADARKMRGKQLPTPGRGETDLMGRFFSGQGSFVSLQERTHFVSAESIEFLELASGTLYLRKAGTYCGGIKGRDFIPSHELALSVHLSSEINRKALSKEAALQYLRKALPGAGGDGTGFHLMTYKEQGIGWAKLMPGRMNNYLPNELRILK